MNIKLISDRMSNVEQEYAKKHNIDVLPLRVLFGEKEYFDGVDINAKEFAKMLKESDVMPMTSQVASGVFYETFKKYLEEGYTVLYIGGSSTASGTFQSATIASNELENDNLYLFDSRNIAIGCGIQVYKAVELINQNLSIDEIISELEKYRDNVYLQFTVENLDYLKKGGRISPVKASIGNMLGIRPIITVEGGLPVAINQIRGSKKLFNKIINDVVAEYKGGQILIVYGDNIEDGIAFKEAVKEALNVSDDIIDFICIGICIASHTGPSGYGISFIK